MGHLRAWNLTAKPRLSNGSKNMARTDALGFKTKRAKSCFQRDSKPLEIVEKSACIASKCQYLTSRNGASRPWVKPMLKRLQQQQQQRKENNDEKNNDNK
jgi:hypothetical protein